MAKWEIGHYGPSPYRFTTVRDGFVERPAYSGSAYSVSTWPTPDWFPPKGGETISVGEECRFLPVAKVPKLFKFCPHCGEELNQ